MSLEDSAIEEFLLKSGKSSLDNKKKFIGEKHKDGQIVKPFINY